MRVLDWRLVSVVLLLVLAAGSASAQTLDTLATPAGAPAVLADTTGAAAEALARRALRRSLLVPGWGQVTNGQRLKAPVIAAALVGATGVLVFQQRRYVRYRRAALVAGCLASPDRDNADCINIPDAATEAFEATGRPSFAQAQRARDTARGRRDLSGLAVGVVYALQALDAYVAAQLLGFDVSEDVAVRAAPGGLALRVRL